MTQKTKTTRKKKVVNTNEGTYLLVNGKVGKIGMKEVRTKLGFPTSLPIIQVLSKRKKVDVYMGLSNMKYKVGQSVELKCAMKKIKSGNRTSIKYILVG